MNSPSTPPERNQLSKNLIQQLLAMRDALVTLSLCIKDWQFELDQQGRQAARPPKKKPIPCSTPCA